MCGGYLSPGCGSVGVFINFVRSTCPGGDSLVLSGISMHLCYSYRILLTVVRFNDLFDSVGIAKSSGVVTAMIMVVDFFPTIYLQLQGAKWHSRD